MLPTHSPVMNISSTIVVVQSNWQALLSTTTEDRAPGMGALPEGTRRGSERDKVPKAIVLGMGADSDHGKDATPLPLP